MAGEALRAALTANARANNWRFFTAESAVFTGSASGTTTTLTYQNRAGVYSLLTALSVVRILNPANASGASTTTNFPGTLRLFNVTKDKEYFFQAPFAPTNLGGLMNQGNTWPSYIYLKPLEMFGVEIFTTNTNQMQFCMIGQAVEYQP